MYFSDMTFDNSQIYAIGEHRWLYGDITIERPEDIQKAALASQKAGYPIVNKAFKGSMPNVIPEHTRNLGDALPKSISYQYAKGSVLRVYQVPADKHDNIGIIFLIRLRWKFFLINKETLQPIIVEASLCSTRRASLIIHPHLYLCPSRLFYLLCVELYLLFYSLCTLCA